MAGYIQFDGVKGESLDDKHKDWSDILSFNQVIHKPGTGTGVARRRGDVTFDDIVVVKALDKASTKIAENVAKGKVYPTVKIELTATGSDSSRAAYYKYELKNVQVLSYSVGGSAQANEQPVEEIGLNFEEIKVTYIPVSAAGSAGGNMEYTWKVEEGKK